MLIMIGLIKSIIYYLKLQLNTDLITDNINLWKNSKNKISVIYKCDDVKP